MAAMDYHERRGQLENYFDRTAVESWARLTSTDPVSRIRATVREGRDRMRAVLMAYLPSNLTGKSVLDAGCGTGALSVEAAQRGADVLAVDLSPTLIKLASQRLPPQLRAGSIEFRVGDMFEAAQAAAGPGPRPPDRFDHVVAMDSLIHYRAADVVRVLARFAARTEGSIVFTFAPKTPALALMWAVGRLFPRGDRAPAIEPISESTLRRLLAAEPAFRSWRIGRTQRVASGFYKSQALELVKL